MITWMGGASPTAGASGNHETVPYLANFSRIKEDCGGLLSTAAFISKALPNRAWLTYWTIFRSFRCPHSFFQLIYWVHRVPPFQLLCVHWSRYSRKLFPFQNFGLATKSVGPGKMPSGLFCLMDAFMGSTTYIFEHSAMGAFFNRPFDWFDNSWHLFSLWCCDE